jgi:hypothetical protein
MRLPRFVVLALLVGFQPSPALSQGGAEPGDPFRIAILVDNSHQLSDPLVYIRRGLKDFLNTLPPNHELMLVTTGGAISIRDEPTRDYLKIMDSSNVIPVMRSGGNALFETVEQVYERYLRNVERRYPMLVVIATDGPDLSPRITNERANALLNGLQKSGVIVNAVLLNPFGWTGSPGSREIRTLTLEMTKRTGGALVQGSGPSVGSRLKNLAGSIAQQYNKLSPDKLPRAEFRK